MTKKYHSVVIGGGCLGCACAFSIQQKLNKTPGKVAVLEKKVLGAGLSSRHSGIVRSANASPIAARMAKLATEHWKNLKPIWGVEIPYEQSGAIWIAPSQSGQTPDRWSDLEASMKAENIQFSMITPKEVIDLIGDAIHTDPAETFYFEPDVLQFDSRQVLNALEAAVNINKVEVIERCQVYDLECDSHNGITALRTNQGKIAADHIVNAAGAWSTGLFAGIGIHVPVAVEPVYAANFLVSSLDIPLNMPTIADFINQVYFRRWGASILHMHQPRSRQSKDIARSFTRALINPGGADVIYDPAGFTINHQQMDSYLAKMQSRFPKIVDPVYAGGYQSFFDITPDLKFILGPDPQFTNLYHCLGAGQSFKYAPLFGELIAELVTENRVLQESIDIDEFSIARFSQKPLSDFWKTQDTASSFL
jgi:sarcosine oxidase, subunit beta